MTVIRQDKGGRDSDRERDNAVIEIEKRNRKLNGQRWKEQSPYFETFMEPGNRFQGRNFASLCGLAGRYDNLFLLGS
jgi:hypothetical protein